MCLSVIQSARENSPVVSYHRKQIFPAQTWQIDQICGYLDQANRNDEMFQGPTRGPASDAVLIASLKCPIGKPERLIFGLEDQESYRSGADFRTRQRPKPGRCVNQRTKLR